MTTNTSYGTWATRIEYGSGLSVDETVSQALSDAHCGKTDTAGITAAYREAINAALPCGVQLCGDEFYGPAGFEPVDFEADGFPVDDDGGLDIDAIVRTVDFYGIVERFDSA